MTNIRDYFEGIEAELQEWRRTLHEHPELAFEEHWTSDFVAQKLESFGYKPVRGLGGTGMVASISNGEGPSIGLRADMDALPVTEQTNLPYASKQPGKMHACGHDGHMTMLLAAARYFSETRDFQGTLHFIFQPAEEGEAGADAMIKDGLFEKFPMQEVYGLHNWPGLEEGTFAGRAGPQMAAFDVFEIKITGQGAHAAMPHLGKDLLLAAANIQTQLQAIVARAVDPLDTAVVSVTQIHGGDAWNVLPSEVVMRGCTRHFTRKVQDLIEAQMGAICKGVAESFGIIVELDYMRRYPATVNTDRETEIALQAAGAVAGQDRVTDALPPSMASEDFAFMLEKKPGCYMWVGAGSTEGGCMLHSPTYKFNDAVLVPGASWWVTVAKTALEQGRGA